MPLGTRQETKVPHIIFVPRQALIRKHKIEPLQSDHQSSNESLPMQSSNTPPPLLTESSPNIPFHLSSQTSDRSFTPDTTDHTKIQPKAIEKKPNLIGSKRKKTILILVIISIVLVCAAVATIPPILLLGTRSSNASSFTNVSVSSCAISQTCIGQETPFRTSMVTVLYSLNGNTNDLTGTLNGMALGVTIPVYSLSWTLTYSIALNYGSQQYVSIPYINLSKQSFTLQIWVFLSYSTPVDYGVFGQCGSDLICLSLSIRYGRVTLSFDSLNSNGTKLVGNTVLTNGYWTHITVTYDAVQLQQMIYVNGRIDAISPGMVYSYQGTSTGVTTSTIGMSSSSGYQPSYFNGNIYLLTISAGSVRSPCQVYNDATLTAYYPLDTVSSLADHSVNMLDGYTTGTAITSSGHTQQAMLFSQTTSCFLAQCFTATRFSNSPFSVSLWINPAVVTSGSVVHFSSNQQGNGSICFDLLAFSSTGAIVAQIYQSTSMTYAVVGPILSVGTWTHLAVVYSYTNGLRLFVNGQAYYTTVTSPISWNFNGVNPLFVTLGNNNPLGPMLTPNCPSSAASVVSGSYSGIIDEFRLYGRELSALEICVLTNY